MLEKLREIRINNEYTYKQIAEFLNVSKSYYWQIEHGKRNLSYKMAFEISKIFNIRPDDIFYKDIKKKIV